MNQPMLRRWLSLAYLVIIFVLTQKPMQRFGSTHPGRLSLLMLSFGLITLGGWWLVGWSCANVWRQIVNPRAAEASRTAALIVGCLLALVLTGLFVEMVLTG